MNKFLAVTIGALAAINCLFAATNSVSPDSIAATSTNTSPEIELQQLMESDDAALDDVDQMIRDNDAFAAKGAGESKDELNIRIRAKLDTIRKRYQDFLRRYPDSASGHLAFGTFLDDTGDGDLALTEFEAARKLDPKNPAAWNNCANYYGEHGPVTNAFVYYAKAIELNPAESVYYQNLATAVFLFRKDAKDFYSITEPQVFDKSLALYQKAIQLDPTNFALASDYAESYYGIRPLRTNDALASWTNALNVAGNETEREGAEIHLARIKIAVGRFAEAQAHLNAVTNSIYENLKSRLEHNLAERENPTTNSVAATNSIAPPK